MSESTAPSTPLAPPPGRCTPGTTLTVSVSTASTQVQAGTQVPLVGVAQEIHWTIDCEHFTQTAPFHWTLLFQPPHGNQTDITSSLQGANTLSPDFIPASEGIFQATLTAGNIEIGIQTATVVITATPQQPVKVSVSGHITALIVQDVGQGFGPEDDFIDVEVVVQLDTQQGKNFGFQLRNDKNRPAHQAMFDLLHDAFDANLAVTLNCLVVPDKNNGTIWQAMLSK